MKFGGIVLMFYFGFSPFAFSAETEKCARQALNAKAFYKLRDTYMSRIFNGDEEGGSLSSDCFKKMEKHGDMQQAIKCIDDDSAIKKEICSSTQESLKKSQQLSTIIGRSKDKISAQYADALLDTGTKNDIPVKDFCSVVEKKIGDIEGYNKDSSISKAVAMNLDFSSTSGCESILQLLHDNEGKKKKDSIVGHFCHEGQTKLKNCPEKVISKTIDVIPVQQKKNSSAGKVNLQ